MATRVVLDPTVLSTLVKLHEAKCLTNVDEAFALFGDLYSGVLAQSNYGEVVKAAANDGRLTWFPGDAERKIEAGFYHEVPAAPAPVAEPVVSEAPVEPEA